MKNNQKFEIDLEKIKHKYEKMGAGFDVETNALYCPNPQEWYSKALLEDNYEDFRVIRNVKETTKIATQTFGGSTASTLYAFDCDWTEGDSNLDATTLTANPYSIMHSICQRDLETSFVVSKMTSGNENWKNEKEFFAHYFEELAKTVAEDLAIAKWQGHVDNGLVFNGFEYLVQNTVGTVGITGLALTLANIEGAFESVLLASPSNVSRKKGDTRFYVSPTTANKIAIAAAKNNTLNYTTKELELFYLGIKISVQEGMSDDIFVFTRKDNMIIGVDAMGDSSNLKIRDLDVINVPKIRTRVDGKLALLVVNPTEVVYYKVVP